VAKAGHHLIHFSGTDKSVPFQNGFLRELLQGLNRLQKKAEFPDGIKDKIPLRG